MACQHVLAQRKVVMSDDALTAHTDLAGTPHSAPLGRLFVREHLRRRLAAEVLVTAELLTTELITNAVRHAGTSIHLGVTCDADNLLVTIEDHSPVAPVERQAIADDVTVSGRGLRVIAALADDFGWSPLPGGSGKVTWFALALTQALPEQRGHDGLPAG